MNSASAIMQKRDKSENQFNRGEVPMSTGETNVMNSMKRRQIGRGLI